MLRGTVWVIDQVGGRIDRFVLEFATPSPIEFERLAKEKLTAEGKQWPNDRLAFGPIGAPWTAGRF